MAHNARSKREKPSKPYSSFPLTAHNNGQWCKKICGRVHFFGVWDGPQAALDRYLRLAADLHSGRLRPASSLATNGTTVKDICNHYLTHQLQRAEAHEIGFRWFEDCRCAVQDFARFAGPSRLVSDLGPEELRRYRQKLVRSGLAAGGKGLGVHALSRAVTIIRGMLKHAFELDLIEKPVKVASAFDKPSASVKRRARRDVERQNGKRLFEPPEIRAMIAATKGPPRATVLLRPSHPSPTTQRARRGRRPGIIPFHIENKSRGDDACRNRYTKR